MAAILHSREGVTQLYPLAMVAYVIGVLQLTKRPKAAYPDVTQHWYTDNAGAIYMFDNMELYFNLVNATARRGGITLIPIK